MRSLFRSRGREPETVPVLPHPSEDILRQLVDYDVIVLMDDSPSMRGPRWRQVRDGFFPRSSQELINDVSGKKGYEAGG